MGLFDYVYSAREDLVCSEGHPVEDVKKFESGLINFVQNAHSELFAKLREKKALTDDIKEGLKTAVLEFKERFTADKVAAAGR